MHDFQRFAAPALAAALALATAGGCASDNASSATLVILQNQIPDTSCQIPVAKGGSFLGRGRIDVSAAGGGYIMTPLVESRAENLDSNDPFQRSISVEGAQVSLTFADESLVDVAGLQAAGATDFTQRFSAVIEPGSLAALSLVALPQAVLDDLDTSLSEGDVTQVLSHVVVFGELGGGDVESNEFAYPIDVCKGCLLVDAGSCVGYQDSGELLCFPGQDSFPVECCTGSDGSRVCPAVAEPAQ